MNTSHWGLYIEFLFNHVWIDILLFGTLRSKIYTNILFHNVAFISPSSMLFDRYTQYERQTDKHGYREEMI